MAGISIPGVSDTYKTNDLVEALMQQERLPLEREQSTLENYKEEQTAWRSVNQNMTSLREAARGLYSFDNPFNNKTATSTQEDAVTATPGRNASFESFKIDVLQPATADRFLSSEIDKTTKVPEGTYKFTTGDKTVSMNWKGGSLQDFVTSLNRRSSGILKVSLIGVSPGKQALLLESLQTGAENRLVFEGASLEFAESIGMIQKIKPEAVTFETGAGAIQESPSLTSYTEQAGLPALSTSNVNITDKTITVAPRGSFSLDIPSTIAADSQQKIEFSIAESPVEDITIALNEQSRTPELPYPGGITFKGITLQNIQSDTTLPATTVVKPSQPLTPVEDTNIVSIQMSDGSEIPFSYTDASVNEDGSRLFTFQMSDYPGATSIIIRNKNTGKELTMTVPEAYNKNADLGYEPVNAANVAADAVIKYEGITISRPTNTIDDIVADVTLNIKNKTERTATIEIKPDTESAKEALITLIGTYNKVVAEINILTQNKPEIIDELNYLTDDEIEQYEKWLGMFQSDFSLTNGKSTMQTIMASPYQVDANTSISMLSQIGISTSADSYSGYSASKLRGYLEIDEAKLDSALESNLLEIKNIFGYDSDGDLIIDSGIAYQLDKQLQGFVQTGGILATKISGLDTRISSSESKIEKLETQLESKEQQLKQKYSQMEATLNSLESQSDSIKNTFNNNKSN